VDQTSHNDQRKCLQTHNNDWTREKPRKTKAKAESKGAERPGSSRKGWSDVKSAMRLARPMMDAVAISSSSSANDTLPETA
jgi:hypothetical protein